MSEPQGPGEDGQSERDEKSVNHTLSQLTGRCGGGCLRNWAFSQLDQFLLGPSLGKRAELLMELEVLAEDLSGFCLRKEDRFETAELLLGNRVVEQRVKQSEKFIARIMAQHLRTRSV